MKLLMLLLSFSPSLVEAQVTVKPNTPFKVQFQSKVDSNELFHFKCDSTILKNWTDLERRAGTTLTADVDGFFTITLDYTPGLANGSHTCSVIADNLFGSVETPSISVPSGNAPGTLKGFKIINTVTTTVISGFNLK